MTYKLQVNISEEMKDRIEFYAKKSGISMSALCNVFIGQGLMGYDTAFDMIDKLYDKAEKEIQGQSSKISIAKR